MQHKFCEKCIDERHIKELKDSGLYKQQEKIVLGVSSLCTLVLSLDTCHLILCLMEKGSMVKNKCKVLNN